MTTPEILGSNIGPIGLSWGSYIVDHSFCFSININRTFFQCPKYPGLDYKIASYHHLLILWVPDMLKHYKKDTILTRKEYSSTYLGNFGFFFFFFSCIRERRESLRKSYQRKAKLSAQDKESQDFTNWSESLFFPQTDWSGKLSENTLTLELRFLFTDSTQIIYGTPLAHLES